MVWREAKWLRPCTTLEPESASEAFYPIPFNVKGLGRRQHVGEIAGAGCAVGSTVAAASGATGHCSLAVAAFVF
jgi:hypothetical protein